MHFSLLYLQNISIKTFVYSELITFRIKETIRITEKSNMT